MLSPRQELLLAKVIDGFATSGQPVASKALAADPEVGIDFSRLVHGGQQFTWGPLVVAGDEISTTVTLTDISSRGPMGFFVFETRSANQDGERVCTGTWTNIVRGD